MAVKIGFTKKSEWVLNHIEKLDKNMKKGIKDAFHDIGFILGVENARVLRNGARTGRVYMIKGVPHQASAPGEPPKTRTGRLAGSYDYRVSSWHRMTVGESAEYANYLENGTPKGKISPRPHLILAINNISGSAMRIFYQKTKEHMRVK